MKFKFYLILVVFFSIACSEKEPEVIDLRNVKKSKYFNINSIISDVEYINILLPDSVTISKVSSSKTIGDSMFIFDLTQEKIFQFDLKSETFIMTLPMIGEGPGEVSNLNSFDLNTNGEIFLYDLGKRIVKFEKDNSVSEVFIEEPLNARDFSIYDSGLLLINPSEGILGLPNTILSYHFKNDSVSDFGGIPINDFFIPVKYFQKYGSDIYINDISTSSLVHFNGKKPEKILEFNFGYPGKAKIVDFWILDKSSIFLFASSMDNQKNGLFYVKNQNNPSRVSGLISPFDLLPINGFPFNELNGEFDYFVYLDEEYESIISFFDGLDNFKSFESDGNQYVFKELPELRIDKDKVDLLKKQFLYAPENSLMIRKLNRK